MNNSTNIFTPITKAWVFWRLKNGLADFGRLRKIILHARIRILQSSERKTCIIYFYNSNNVSQRDTTMYGEKREELQIFRNHYVTCLREKKKKARKPIF